MRDASLLAAKFFRDLADIFDGKSHAAGKCIVFHSSFNRDAANNAPRKLILNYTCAAMSLMDPCELKAWHRRAAGGSSR